MEQFEKSLNFPLFSSIPYTFDYFLCEIPHIEDQIDILYELYCRQVKDVVLRDPVIDQNLQQLEALTLLLENENKKCNEDYDNLVLNEALLEHLEDKIMQLESHLPFYNLEYYRGNENPQRIQLYETLLNQFDDIENCSLAYKVLYEEFQMFDNLYGKKYSFGEDFSHQLNQLLEMESKLTLMDYIIEENQDNLDEMMKYVPKVVQNIIKKLV